MTRYMPNFTPSLHEQSLAQFLFQIVCGITRRRQLGYDGSGQHSVLTIERQNQRGNAGDLCIFLYNADHRADKGGPKKLVSVALSDLRQASPSAPIVFHVFDGQLMALVETCIDAHLKECLTEFGDAVRVGQANFEG